MALQDVALLDSITKLEEEHRGVIVVAGSHGGLYAGYCAAKGGVRGVILNDAGIGRDRAGISALAYLDRAGIAAATVGSMSCHICNAEDAWRSGVISHINEHAAHLGCAAGQSVVQCSTAMRRAGISKGEVPPVQEARKVFQDDGGGVRIIGIDSASLLLPADEGQIVVTGSHGGVPSGDPKKLTQLAPLAMTFNDAGGCKDGSGYARLAVLERRGIASIAVNAETAYIGDAWSCYSDGLISQANAIAEKWGAIRGQPLRTFLEGVVKARPYANL